MTKIVDSSAWPLTREPWTEFAPMVGRLARFDPTTPVRLIHAGSRRTALARLPFGALVDRTIATPDPDPAGEPGTSPDVRSVDVTARADELLAWLGLTVLEPAILEPKVLERKVIERTLVEHALPERADASWRGGRPPAGNWQRVDTVPGEVVRDLVRQGAQAHLAAADQGLGARAADALLDLVVLTVSSATAAVTVTNRSLSALSGMGFLPPGGNVVVSTNRGWTRVAGEFGSAYAEPVRSGLTLL